MSLWVLYKHTEFKYLHFLNGYVAMGKSSAVHPVLHTVYTAVLSRGKLHENYGYK